MLTTQTDPPVTPVTPVPCKCSQPLSEHCTNSHTVTPWQKGLKALEDTLDCLDAFEAGTRERPPRLDDTLVDWFHRRHPSDLGLTFNAIKPRLDEAWAEHARRKEAEVARLQELQRRAGSSVSTPRSPPASQQSPRPTGQPQARSTPVTTAQVTRPPPPQSFAAAAQTPVTHKSQARLPCSTKDPKARPADCELILKTALYHGFVMAQGIMARDLAEVNGPWQGVLDEVFTVAWHQCTSFHHRLIHGLRITDEQMEHHLQQARNYSRIVARQIERQEFNNLTDPSRLTFVGNLERPGATDYFKIVVPFDEERVVEASSDPRELFHQLPLDRLQPAFQEVIKNGREGWYDHHALGNKLSKVASAGRVWKIHNSARRQADELGSPPSQQ